MKKALVLLSGGQDSTTCLYWALENFSYVEAVGFDYGQRHSLELKFAKKTALIANVNFEIISINNLFKNSALINKTQDLNAIHPTNKKLPSSFVPGRNILFISLASSIAYNKKIDNIVTGVCETDYSGYPDCRKEFIDSIKKSISIGLDYNINIHTPLMNLDKAKIWKLAKELGCIEIIINNTMTDYNGSQKKNEWGYGKLDNPASKLRSQGYYAAKKNKWI